MNNHGAGLDSLLRQVRTSEARDTWVQIPSAPLMRKVIVIELNDKRCDETIEAVIALHRAITDFRAALDNDVFVYFNDNEYDFVDEAGNEWIT